ncbi:MAG: hypothetical protein V3V82_07695, partial [Acidimicrobiia bacterium]
MPLHLEEHLDAATIVGSEVPADLVEPVEWRFDEPQPGWKAVALGELGPATVLQIDDALRISLGPANERSGGSLLGAVFVDVPDWDHRDWAHVLIRARSSSPGAIGLNFNNDEWGTRRARLVDDGTVQTYQVWFEPRRTYERAIGQLGIQVFADEPLEVEILSITVVPMAAAYAEAPAGVLTVHRDNRYRRSLFMHTPARLEYRVRVPEEGRLDTGLGTQWSEPSTTFRVTVRADGESAETLLEESHGDREMWAQRSIDLSAYAGQVVT